jgi:aspartate/methionine/tyrosine aminotransferase
MIILGIDPGLNKTGWGVISFEKGVLKFIACGAINTSVKDSLCTRLGKLSTGLAKVLAEHDPDEVAIEETFVSKGAQSALKLGQARGALILTVAQAKLPLGVLKPRALLLKPGYNLYDNQLIDLGFELDKVALPKAASDDEKLALIKAAITPDTVILPITNPNNPTGEIYSEKFLRGLLGLIDEFPRLNIINDAVYDHILRVGVAKPVNIFALGNNIEKKRVFEVNSLAKAYAYPAIRAGWAIGEEKVIAEIQESKDPILGPLNNIAQLVTISALKHTPSDYLENVKAVYDRRLKLVHDKLHQIKGFKSEIPLAAFYYWADFSGVIEVKDLIHQLKAKNILLSDGAKFGDANCIRINCGASDEALITICDAIVETCAANV